jgi:CRP-like cAMP-binding protein
MDEQAPNQSASLTTEECRQTFATVPFMAELTENDTRSLQPLMHSFTFSEGETLFEEGDPGDALYFVQSGTIEVFKSDDLGGRLPLITLSGTGVLGEMGLLSNAPRTATALATSEVRALRLSHSDFQAALDEGNMAAYRLVLALARVLSQRLSAMDHKLFTLFQADENGVRFRDLDDIRHRLLTSWIV